MAAHLSPKLAMTRKLLLTDDGSATFYWDKYDEPYHSKHGAMQESQYVYIEQGLLPAILVNSTIYIFEMGLGTGLNALLTYQAQKIYEAAQLPFSVHYTAIEAYPLLAEEVAGLNYATRLPTENRANANSFLTALHEAEWGKSICLTPTFTVHKINCRLEEVSFLPVGKYHVVYFDAFAPNSQPELWKAPVFSVLAAAMANGGRLTTYCAQGEMRRALRAAGLEVVRLPGPIGKREMTLAIKP